MKSWSIVVVAVLVAASLGFSSAQPAQSDRPRLADLGWLEGTWSGDAFGGRCDEIWSAPSGGSMMGMFRLVAEEQTSLFEFLLLEQTSSGVTLRFKHFGPGYKAWEQDAALEFELTDGTDTRWIFESPDATQSPSRVIYARPDTDKLIVTVETRREGRDPESFDVVLKRGE